MPPLLFVCIITCYSAGTLLTGAGAGIVVSTGDAEIADFDAGFVIVKEDKMLIMQMKTAKLQVAFSMKSVVLRYPKY